MTFILRIKNIIRQSEMDFERDLGSDYNSLITILLPTTKISIEILHQQIMCGSFKKYKIIKNREYIHNIFEAQYFSI